MRLDPFSTTYRHTPATTWHRLLADGEHVSYDDDLGLWIIGGYHLVRTALRETALFSNAATLTPIGPVAPAAQALLAGFTVAPVGSLADPPAHDRSRDAVRMVLPNTAYRVQEKWSRLVQYRADEFVSKLAQHLAADTTVDIVEHVSNRLPLLIMLDLLGAPTTDTPQIAAWADGHATLIWGRPDEATQLAAAQGLVALWDYCRALVGARLHDSEGHDDLLAGLLRYRRGNDVRLTLDEVAAITLNFLLAGWQTTASLLTHAIEYALAAPQRWTRLAGDARYAADHVEETLRHSPPIDAWLRLSTTTVTMAGVQIPPGARCLLLIGAGNHDPEAFTNPGDFDPDRRHFSQPLSFGTGRHFCPGAALARLQATTVLTTMAHRLPLLTLPAAYERRYTPNICLRLHHTLPVTDSTAGCPMAHAAPGAHPGAP